MDASTTFWDPLLTAGCFGVTAFLFVLVAGHEFGSGVEDNAPDQHMTLSDATDRGSQFVEKDTNKISQWYVRCDALCAHLFESDNRLGFTNACRGCRSNAT